MNPRSSSQRWPNDRNQFEQDRKEEPVAISEQEKQKRKMQFRMLTRLVIYIKCYLIIFLFLNVNFTFILSIILWGCRWGCWFPQQSPVLVINTLMPLTNGSLLGRKGIYLNKWTSKYAYIVASIVFWKPWKGGIAMGDSSLLNADYGNMLVLRW